MSNEQIKDISAVLHILDTNLSSPIISKSLLEINEEIETFLVKHISKMFSDMNIQKAFFSEDSQILKICNDYSEGTLNIIESSELIARSLFDIMLRNIDIPSCDVIICKFTCDNSNMFGIFKLNYKTGYSHYVNQSENGASNAIVIQRALLPMENQKVDEFALINLTDKSISLIQKEYEINGVKECYWSNLFLKCQSQLSNAKKLKIIEKAAKDVTKRHFDEDFTLVAQSKKAIAEKLEEGCSFEINEIAEEIFKDDEILKNEYISEIKKAGLREDLFEVPQNFVSKKHLVHKVKTDNGIEINFPAHYFDDSNKIEFVNNVDGTISILIKNISIK